MIGRPSRTLLRLLAVVDMHMGFFMRAVFGINLDLQSGGTSIIPCLILISKGFQHRCGPAWEGKRPRSQSRKNAFNQSQEGVLQAPPTTPLSLS